MSDLQGFLSIDFCAAAVPPGVPMLEYAALADVATGDLELAFNSAYNQQDTVTVSGGWLSMPFAPGSGSWQEEQQDSDQGPVFTVSISGLLPGDSAEIREEINRMKRHRFLLRVPNRDGTKSLVGWPEQPAVVETRFDSGAAAGDARGWRILFRATQLWPSPHYQPVF